MALIRVNDKLDDSVHEQEKMRREKDRLMKEGMEEAKGKWGGAGGQMRDGRRGERKDGGAGERTGKGRKER